MTPDSATPTGPAESAEAGSLPPGTIAAWRARVDAVRSPTLQRLTRLPGYVAAGQLSEAIDTIVREACLSHFALARAQWPGWRPRMVLLAMGGYGRRQLNLRTNIDVLCVVPEEAGGAEHAFATALFRTLAAIGLELGSGLRTAADCLAAVGTNLEFATVLLDARPVAGSRRLWGRVASEFLDALRGRGRDWFIAGRLDERRARHQRHGTTVSVLQLDLRDGCGGLRDLHDILWLGKVVAEEEGLEGIAAAGFLNANDHDALRRAHGFLLRVRDLVHLRRGVRHDLLEPEDQGWAARALGYVARADMTAEEQLLRDGYRHAHDVHQITGRAVWKMTGRDVDEESREMPAPSGHVERVPPCYLAIDGALQLDEATEAEWEADETSLVTMFVPVAAKRLHVGSGLEAKVRARLAQLDLAAFRASPAVRDAFLAVLGLAGRAGHALREMSDRGVLGAYIPEWEALFSVVRTEDRRRLTGDEHTLRTIEAAEALLASVPTPSHVARIAEGIARRELLVFGLLLHDVGMGGGPGHVVRGAQIARRLAERIALPDADADTLEFLVMHHRRMAHVALRRDLGDARVVREFSAAVGSRPRLDMLYVITYADIAAAAPDAWTAWKERLLLECYQRTSHALETGEVGSPAHEAIPEGLEARVAAYLPEEAWREHGARLHHLLAQFPASYFRFTPPEFIAQHLEMMARRTEAEPLVWKASTPADGSAGNGTHTDLVLCGPDVRGLFRLVARALASRGIDVSQARAWGTREGTVTEHLQVNVGGRALPPSLDLESLRALINAVLGGDTREEEAFGPLPALAPADPAREARMPTTVTIDNAASDACSVIEVHTPDRPALMVTVTELLTRTLGLFLHQALISAEEGSMISVLYATDQENNKIEEEGAIARVISALDTVLREGSKPAAPSPPDADSSAGFGEEIVSGENVVVDVGNGGGAQRS